MAAPTSVEQLRLDLFNKYYNGDTINRLRTICSRRGISTLGSKSDMAKRLVEQDLADIDNETITAARAAAEERWMYRLFGVSSLCLRML